MAINDKFNNIVDKNKTAIPNNQNDVKEVVYIFVSFDICDSTILKQKYQNIWSDVINQFMTYNKIPNMQFWKFNGDELLFKGQIETVTEIISVIEYVYHKIFAIQATLQKHVPNLYIKSTIWMARVNSTEKSQDYTIPNHLIKYSDKVDFIGENIDEGFRLTGHSSKQKLVIDPKIICVLIKALEYAQLDVGTKIEGNDFANSISLTEKTVNSNIKGSLIEFLKKMYFLGYKNSKGIWNGRDYPIIIYIDPKELQFENVVHYDEYFNKKETLELVKNINSENANQDQPKKILEIKRIIEQIGKKSELDNICKLLCYDKPILPRDVQETAILYYMVVCYDAKTNSVLVAKRGNGRKHLANVWDFGNVKHNTSNDLKMSLKGEYKNEFGVDISLFLDENREDNLKPFSFCTIYRNGKKHNGVMFFAKIINDIPTGQTLEEYVSDFIHKSNRYSEIKFVNKAEIDDLFCELTYDEVKEDSELFSSGRTQKNFIDKEYAIPNLIYSVKEAIDTFDSK